MKSLIESDRLNYGHIVDLANNNMNTTENSSTIFNKTLTTEESGPLNSDDATWILTSAFIIFTMQSGFGLVESGMWKI